MFTYTRQWNQTKVQWVTGAEVQRGLFNTKDYKNLGGRPDSLQTDDDINNLKTEEAIFKKELVASLKEKVKILQDNVKDIKTQKK